MKTGKLRPTLSEHSTVMVGRALARRVTVERCDHAKARERRKPFLFEPACADQADSREAVRRERERVREAFDQVNDLPADEMAAGLFIE